MHPFIERIRTERRVIAFVNNRLVKDVPRLQGLSKGAIKSWFEALKTKSSNVAELSYAEECLFRLCNQIRMNSGLSHRGAMIAPLDIGATLESELSMLGGVLQKL